jgi:hypothetical protein
MRLRCLTARLLWVSTLGCCLACVRLDSCIRLFVAHAILCLMASLRGVVVGSDFFYMANIQGDQKSDFNPITILKLHL